MIPGLARHGAPLMEQDVAEGTDQNKEVLRRSKPDVLFLVFMLISGIKTNTEVIILNKVKAKISNMFNLINNR